MNIMKLILVQLLLSGLSGRIEGFVVSRGQSRLTTTDCVNVGSWVPLSAEASPESESFKDGETSDEESADLAQETEQPATIKAPQEPRLVGVSQSEKKLDPLVRSLTRMDEETANAPTMNVPLWGELILDKSLFVFLPVAGFAIVGFFLSLYVALGAGDAFVALEEAATSGKKAPIEQTAEGCRGICSSQDEDLEGLRKFMTGISGRN